MLSIRDENAVNAAQAARLAPGKGQLAPKTPGARYPKTPLKIPLNDENAVGAGKTVLAPKSNANGTIHGTAKKQQNLVTPSETRARAPLGNKTTNAKARSNQNTGVKDGKDSDKSQTKPTTTKKLKQRSPVLRLEVRNDQAGPAEEPDVEYAPPPARDLPYESDVFPNDPLTFEALKPENVFKGYYNHFYNPMGEDGVRLQERKHQEKLQKALKESDDRILQDIQDMDWSVSDVPETASFGQKKPAAPAPIPKAVRKTVGGAVKYPPTIASRRAASALSMSTGPTIRQKKAAEPAKTTRRPISALLPRTRPTKTATVAPKSSVAESAVGEAASRSTLGYTKGRSASSFVGGRGRPASTARPASVDLSAMHRKTVVRRDASPQKKEGRNEGIQELNRLQFLSIFDPAGDEEDDELGNAGPRNEDFEEEEFEMQLSF
ncbi:hypothetical protein C8035_v012528 [Colletotrichum spinosum]|uniref:Uncharacterized protein n=1 Tax=Colletotrichum spinosum TaxID=1347390 RepID=A0A4R8QEB8_9PEZI|nr:hypothetical protein C8035_v012528 [Colletotrichum spinosum]